MPTKSACPTGLSRFFRNGDKWTRQVRDGQDLRHIVSMSQVNDLSGVIPVLEQLLEQSSATQYAYLCHSCVHHVSRLKKEGKRSSETPQETVTGSFH